MEKTSQANLPLDWALDFDRVKMSAQMSREVLEARSKRVMEFLAMVVIRAQTITPA